MASQVKHVSFQPTVTSYVFFKSSLKPLEIEVSALQDKPPILFEDKCKFKLLFQAFEKINHQTPAFSNYSQDQLEQLLFDCDHLFYSISRCKEFFFAILQKCDKGRLFHKL